MIWEKIDKDLFILINNRLHNELFDLIMPFVRSPQLWIPFYIFMLLFVLINYNKNSWKWVLFFAILPMITDYISSGIIKEHIYRLRPCNDLQLSSQARFLLNYRPQSSSFTSSHATSHFALAAFFFNTLESKIGKWGYLFYIWALVICYAQIYVGVHYPVDVICGGLLGFTIGKLYASFFNKKFQLI